MYAIEWFVIFAAGFATAEGLRLLLWGLGALWDEVFGG